MEPGLVGIFYAYTSKAGGGKQPALKLSASANSTRLTSAATSLVSTIGTHLKRFSKTRSSLYDQASPWSPIHIHRRTRATQTASTTNRLARSRTQHHNHLVGVDIRIEKMGLLMRYALRQPTGSSASLTPPATKPPQSTYLHKQFSRKLQMEPRRER